MSVMFNSSASVSDSLRILLDAYERSEITSWTMTADERGIDVTVYAPDGNGSRKCFMMRVITNAIRKSPPRERIHTMLVVEGVLLDLIDCLKEHSVLK